jgi:NAD(P)-dependent dehydrogenase (short-subunit alcohol dehydrogenase family)
MEFAADAVALVVGGASGIGAGIARRLSAEGVPLIVADLDLAAATRLASELGGDARAVDVTEPASVAALYDGLDVLPSLLVHSAGGAARHPAVDIDEATWAQSFQLNAGGFFRTAQQLARRLIAAGRPGSILQIASALHEGPAPGLAHFAAAKAASVTLVRCFAGEWAASGIRVNALTPGPIDTPMTRRAWQRRSPQEQAEFVARIPLGRLGTPDDVASLAAFLLAEDARWITGSVFSLDGGLAVGPNGVKG